MDFMGANKTQIAISESPMAKRLLYLKWYIKLSVTEVGISGSDKTDCK